MKDNAVPIEREWKERGKYRALCKSYDPQAVCWHSVRVYQRIQGSHTHTVYMNNTLTMCHIHI